MQLIHNINKYKEKWKINPVLLKKKKIIKKIKKEKRKNVRSQVIVNRLKIKGEWIKYLNEMLWRNRFIRGEKSQ